MPEPSKRAQGTSAQQFGYGLGAFAIVAGSFVATVLLRMDLFIARGGAEGIETTCHVLRTSMALGASDPA